MNAIQKIQLELVAQNSMTRTYSILCKNINSLTSIPHTVRTVCNICNFSFEFLSTKEGKSCTYRRGSWNCVSHAYVPVCNSKMFTASCSIMNHFAVSLNLLMCKKRKVTVRTSKRSLTKWLCSNFNSCRRHSLYRQF